MAGTDPSPGEDPFVGRIEEGGEVVVGDLFARKGAAGSDDFHISVWF
jgi:hypothetical protein